MREYNNLVREARNACKKSFLANLNTNRRYGAAVLTKNGNVYSSGQYSSYNHITSIHAEMGAVLLATMSGDPQIVACAVAVERVDKIADEAKSCGICLQFLKEHAERTHTEIDMCIVGMIISALLNYLN